MKVIFLGSPDFSAKILEYLLASSHEVVAVVTQPDKEAGRGQKIISSPVKTLAQKHNIKVYQFNKIRLEGSVLKQLNADIMVTAAFGQILSQENIDITPNGIINVHASLLPKYRGSSPIQWAVINGEKATGITIMKTETGIDTGDVLLMEKTPILKDETAGELFERLSDIGGKLLIKALDLIEAKKAKFTPQNHAEMSYFPMLKKEMGKIDFNNTPQQIVNLVNGLNPWPLAFIVAQNNIKIKVYKATVVNSEIDAPNGQILFADSKNGLTIKCSNGAIRLTKIQAPGGKVLDDKVFLNGNKIEVLL